MPTSPSPRSFEDWRTEHQTDVSRVIADCLDSRPEIKKAGKKEGKKRGKNKARPPAPKLPDPEQLAAAEAFVWAALLRDKAHHEDPARLPWFVRSLFNEFRAATLLPAAQQGDEIALEQLWKLFEKPVRSQIRLRLGPNFPDTDELVADVFRILEKKVKTLDADPAGLRGWLARTARNVAVSRWRESTPGAGKRIGEFEVLEELVRVTAGEPRFWHYLAVFVLCRTLRLTAEQVASEWLDRPFTELPGEFDRCVSEMRTPRHEKAERIILPDAPDDCLGDRLPANAGAREIENLAASAERLAVERIEGRWPAYTRVREGLRYSHARNVLIREELLRMALNCDADPHWIAGFILNKLLGPEGKEKGYKPEQIRAQFGDWPLHRLAEWLQSECAEATAMSPTRVVEIFAPFRASVAPGTPMGESTLQQCAEDGSLTRSLPRWSNEIKRHVLRRLEKLEAECLRTIFSQPEPVHKLVCFGLMRVIGWDTGHVAQESSQKLNDLVEIMKQEYVKKSTPPDPARARCFAPLAPRLAEGKLIRNGHRTLAECFGSVRHSVFIEAVADVEEKLIEKIPQGAYELIFWIICGYRPRGKR